MEPQHNGHNHVLCDLCNSADHPLHCESCQINLCRACVSNHLLDSFVTHQIIPFEKRELVPIYPICKEHSPKKCYLHCEECNGFVCVHCITSSNHKNHKIIDSEIKFKISKDNLQRDLHE